MAEQTVTSNPEVITMTGGPDNIKIDFQLAKGNALGEHLVKLTTLTGSDIKVRAGAAPIAATPTLGVAEEELLTLVGAQQVHISGTGTVKISS